MKFKSFLAVILYFYIIWIPFEWFILKWLSTNYQTVRIVRVSLDLLPTGIMALCLLIGQVKLLRFNVSLVFLLFATLLLLISTNIIHQGEMESLIAYAGTLFRFVPFAIIIPNLLSNDFNFERFAYVSKALLLLLIFLGLLESILKQPMRDFLLPAQSMFPGTPPVAYREESFYQISATFVNTIDYCFYIIGLYVLYASLGRVGKRERFLVSLLAVMAVYLTHSLAGLVSISLIVFFVMVPTGSFRYACYTLGLIFFVFLIHANWAEVEWYLRISERYSRIGIIVHTLPYFFSSSFVDFLFGLGTDGKVVYETILSYPRVPIMLLYDEEFSSLKDVYWVALLIQQGILSFALLILVLLQMYFLSSGLTSEKMRIVKTFLVMVFCLGFVNQILDVKSFSFLFWVVMGLMFKDLHEQAKERILQGSSHSSHTPLA